MVTPVPHEIADKTTGENVPMPLSRVPDQDDTLSLSSLLREPIHSLGFDQVSLHLDEEVFERSFFDTMSPTANVLPFSLDDHATISLSKSTSAEKPTMP